MDSQDDSTTTQLQYGDQFRHTITGDTVTVQDVRENSHKVTLIEGGWEDKDELVSALNGELSLYEPA